MLKIFKEKSSLVIFLEISRVFLLEHFQIFRIHVGCEVLQEQKVIVFSSSSYSSYLWLPIFYRF